MTLTTYRGEQVIGVPNALGCGYADPIGNYSSPEAYFRFNYTTQEEYLYRVGFRTYAPDSLSNSIWFFYETYANAGDTERTVNKADIDISKTNAAGDFKIDNAVCYHFKKPVSTSLPDTITIRPREPGAMIAEVWFEMIPQPKILSASSACGGDCNPDQAVPIRIFFEDFVCAASNKGSSLGSVIVKGPGGEHTCPTLETQLRDLQSGNWYTECVIPRSITKGNIEELSASIAWPTSPNMPPLAGPTQVNVARTEQNLAWIAAPACVVALLLGYVCYIYYKRWKATKNAPKDANNLCTMFVAARGVALLSEKLPEASNNAVKKFDATVRSASSNHNCYIARKIHESYLIVAKDPKDLYLAAAQIQLELSQTNWYKLLTGKDAPEIKINENVAALDALRTHRSSLGSQQRSNSRTQRRRTSTVSVGEEAEDEEGRLELYGNVNVDLAKSIETPGSLKEMSAENAAGVDNSNSNNNPYMDATTKTSLANRVSNNNNNSNDALNGFKRQESSNSLFSRTSTSKTSNSRRTANVVQNGITCSIAIVIGKGRVRVHEAGTVSEYESYEYSGPVIDEAATLVDLAHPAQTLTTQTIRDQVGAHTIDSCNGTFTEIAERMIKGKMTKVLQFNPSGCDVAHQGLMQEEENVDSMQAQLDADASGFAKKICSVLYLELHGLTDHATQDANDREAFLEKYKALYKPIQEIITHSGGTLVNITSTNMMVVWNAFTPSPMHVTRASTCIFRLRELFNSSTILKRFQPSSSNSNSNNSHAGKISFCGGMSTSTALVGSLEPNQAHKQVFGLNWESAQELMRLARPYALHGALNCPVFAVWNSRSDLNNCAQLQFVDIIGCRDRSTVQQQISAAATKCASFGQSTGGGGGVDDKDNSSKETHPTVFTSCSYDGSSGITGAYRSLAADGEAMEHISMCSANRSGASRSSQTDLEGSNPIEAYNNSNNNNNIRTQHPQTAANSTMISTFRGIVAIMHESKSSAKGEDADNEWLYELEEKQNNNPYHETNNAFICLLNEFVGDAEEQWNQTLRPKLEAIDETIMMMMNDDTDRNGNGKNVSNHSNGSAVDNHDSVRPSEVIGLRRLKTIMEETWNDFKESSELYISRRGIQ